MGGLISRIIGGGKSKASGSGAASSSHQFSVSYADDRRSAAVAIPSRYHGVLIGPGGATAKELRDETGVSFEVPKRGSDDEIVKTGTGDPEAVERLVQRLCEVAGEAQAADAAREAEHQAVHDDTAALFSKYQEKIDKLYTKRNALRQQSQEAFKDGRKAEAKELSNSAKALQAKIEKLEKEASGEVFQSRNKGFGVDKIDLHGLYLEPAMERLRAHLDKAKKQGAKQTEVVYGAGSHSGAAGPKIKPACLAEFKKRKFRWEEANHGSAIVFLA